METHVFVIVLFAALLHSTWNAVVKGRTDKHLGMTAVVLGHIPISLVALPFARLPDIASWPYFLGGIV